MWRVNANNSNNYEALAECKFLPRRLGKIPSSWANKGFRMTTGRMIESIIPENPMAGLNISGLCHTSRLIGDFVQILGSKFWALGA